MRARMDRSWLAGRRIAVAVGGGIAAYKAGDLVRELRRAGAQTRVVMTPAAQAFVTPLLLQGLSGHAVLTEILDPAQDAKFGHLDLSRWADAFVVAPATADLIGRLAGGLANDAATTALIAFRGPVLLAPAMNTAMWDNERTQENLRTLRADARYRVVGPGVGPLADGDVGAGRLAELPELVDAVAALGGQGPLVGKHVLITAGPTREALDPVRFLSNPSTGKMGLALAAEARARGARVTVVLGPVPERPKDAVEVVDVTSADEMAEAVLARIDGCDVFVAAAAVSDFKAAHPATQKVKKTEQPEPLALVRTPDVLALASERVHRAAKRPVLVGFAAETENVLANAQAKLAGKKLDHIVANDVSKAGQGFGADRNVVTIVSKSGATIEAQGTKREVAARIWDEVAR